METWLCVAEHTAAVGRLAPACASTERVRFGWKVDIRQMTASPSLFTDHKGVSISTAAFELRLNIQAVTAVWYWHSMEANPVKGTEDSGALW